ncbi:histidine phosphatase family protein [uncultured Hymenobacter sp.]|uniref:histidine phosphatase family protein n=1 Tax=uncultured Hymenobacter sp. TaxID=170016 RepID=UPI0035CB2222
MSRLAFLHLLLWPLLALTTQCATRRSGAANQPTTIYIVRHAEKDLTPNLPDPSLTPEGQQRALALRDTLLRRKPWAAVFSTATSRTRTTAEPLAQVLKLPIQDYDPKQLPALARRIRQSYPGETVLVVGHSNTILETAEAFGAPRPVPTIGDNEYDYLLEVKLPRDSTQAATAVARRYGGSSAGR